MPSATRSKSEQSEHTREQLIDAAAELFAERGYDGTSVQAIGELAGISRGSVFWHFGSKEGLLWALAEREFGRWTAEVLAPMVGDAIGVEALRKTIAAHRLFLEQRPGDLRLLHVLMFEALGPRPELAAEYARLHAGLAQMGGAWLAAGIEAGEVDAGLDPIATATCITAALGGIAYQYLLDPEGFDAAAAYEQLTLVFVRGVSPVPQG